MSEQKDDTAQLTDMEERVEALDDVVFGRTMAFQAVLVEILVRFDKEQATSILNSAMPDYNLESLLKDREEYADMILHHQAVLEVAKETVQDLEIAVRRRREANP